MANDADWVDDVRRWYFGGHPPEGEVAVDGAGGLDEHAVGFEASVARDVHRTPWPDGLIAGNA